MPRGIPTGVMNELEELFERAAKAPSGFLLYEVSPQRANFLAKWANNLKVQSAIESTEMYESTDSRFGRGLYWNLKARVVPQGLCVFRTGKLELSKQQIIIEAALRGDTVTITKENEEQASQLAQHLRVIRGRLAQKMPVSNFSEVQIVQEGPQIYIYVSVMDERRIRILSEAEAKLIVDAITNQPTDDDSDGSA